MRINHINIDDYNYTLPKERIAAFPLSDRASSKLLIFNKQKEILHEHFKSITDYLPSQSLLVINDTKVISARLILQKPTGGIVEVLLVDPLLPSTDPSISLASKESCVWKCIVGGRNLFEGMVLKLSIPNQPFSFSAEIISRASNSAEVCFRWLPFDLSFSELINTIGIVPLPPYINREPSDDDKHNYQTIYASHEGSIAAPTAGLHFTNEVLNDLKKNSIDIARVNLHVGPGTFQPVTESDASQHEMHGERIAVDNNTLQKLIDSVTLNKSIIATGTTSLRTLETLYWLGVKLILKKPNLSSDGILFLDQYDAYALYSDAKNISVVESLTSLMQYNEYRGIDHLEANTKLYIMPGFIFNICDILITNFHLPKSTLLLLVSAFIGNDNWVKIYNEALSNNYRFLSFGDSSLLYKCQTPTC